MGQAPTIQFTATGAVPADGLVANVRHSLALRLHELRDFEYPWAGALTVVANGPSARQAPLAGKTLAINGALRLFTDAGLAPTYWVACDPQELVVDFLAGELPRSTTYLVASKCHPAVFERLSGYNVVVWHTADEATWALLEDRYPCAAWVSVTLGIFELMARLGWRSFDVWGWDGCRLDGLEHAVPSEINPGEDIEVIIGDRPFSTTHTWALEAQTAINALAGFPFPVHVHGPGMIAAVLKHFLPKRIVTDPA